MISVGSFATSKSFPIQNKSIEGEWSVPYRVLVTDKLAEEGLELLRAEKEVELIVDTKLAKDPQALREALKNADGIAIRSGTQLTAEILADQPRLKAIVRAGVGVDNIDVPAATRQGIVVMNTPGGNTISTAEHTMALMLSLAATSPRPTRASRPASGTAAASPAPSLRARPWASSVSAGSAWRSPSGRSDST